MFTIKEKIKVATILGTLQASLTEFKYVRKIWQKNCEEERLLGVSLTGIMDHPVLGKNVDSAKWLAEMKQVAIDTNAEYAERLGIEVSAAITCVKPSGTVSLLACSTNGVHWPESQYYIRRMRISNNCHEILKMVRDAGYFVEPAKFQEVFVTRYIITHKNVGQACPIIL